MTNVNICVISMKRPTAACRENLKRDKHSRRRRYQRTVTAVPDETIRLLRKN